MKFFLGSKKDEEGIEDDDEDDDSEPEDNSKTLKEVCSFIHKTLISRS